MSLLTSSNVSYRKSVKSFTTEGLNPISNDVEYVAFIFDAYGTDGVILVYVDHIGVGVDGWLDDEDNDHDEHESCIDGENEDNIDELRNDAFEFNEDVLYTNSTSNDPFLSNLCVDDEDENNILMDINCVLKKYDRTRLLVRCSKGACTFRLWASWMSDEESFQIKSLKAYHDCSRNFMFGSLVTYAWIGSNYTKDIVESQKISVRKLRLKVMAKFGIQVSMGKCRRAKKYALKLVEGSFVEHYGKLRSYGHEILRTNHGLAVKLDMEYGPYGKKYFSKFYCCFQGVKQGWIEGCRRIIGLDGCFLKELLINDIKLNLGNGLSLMLDQHKGLIEVVKELLPYVEDRQCARHICHNLQKRFTAAIYHTLFWRVSKATTEHAFKVVMKEIETLNLDAHQYLMEKDPKTWSRSFFQTGRCQEEAIITMSEEIRFYMMDRIYNMKLKGQQWGNHICPEIRDKVNLLKKAQSHYQDILLNRDVEAYVDNMFSTTTFRKAYNYKISPMNSSDMWPEANYTPLLTPINRRMPGRAATKRKKSTTENTRTHMVSKAGKKIKCIIRKEIGHKQGHLSTKKAPKVKCEETEDTKSLCEAKCRTCISEPQQHE
ncbi:unnamed protein product [Lactuca saligna]|uniref:Transposase MuDR plant domain-containing protein n=1 Tax=Lactuca saligna TaxID=75948 RepID=A0AA35VM05_LACSI|nr:unnamed protein product [Lactuca saligna]